MGFNGGWLVPAQDRQGRASHGDQGTATVRLQGVVVVVLATRRTREENLKFCAGVDIEKETI